LEARTLIAEFKRRHVFRALLAYGIAAFAVLQIVEPTMHGLHWPEAVLSYVVVALAAGFPLVVSLAWIFDVSAGRIERTAPATAGELKGARLALVLVGLGLVAAAPGIIYFFAIRGGGHSATERTTSTDAVPGSTSVAVLPFADMSPGKDQEYFADGIAEEILNALAQVEGLHVSGRTSSFSFKGKPTDLAEIGRRLNVATVLEGSVRKAGSQMRITAQLVNTSDGFHVWSRTFDRDLTEIFPVQEEIARDVVAALKVRLLPGRAPSTKWMRTSNPEVHNQYLLGREFDRRGSTDDWRRALAAYEKALALDPEYAPAWAGVSFVTFLLEAYYSAEPDQGQRALAAADRAIALAPEFADGYRARALVRRQIFFDWVGAQVDLERALALSPGDVGGTVSHAYFLGVLGRIPEAIAAARKATELDPLYATSWTALGKHYTFNNDFDRGAAALNRALEIAPEHEDALYFLGINLVASGHANDALALAKRSRHEMVALPFIALAQHDLGNVRESEAALEMLIAKGGARDSAYQLAQVYAWRGDHDPAFEWLERSYVQRDSGLPGFQNDPLLRKLHDDPRWKPFLKKMKLPAN